MSKPTPEASGVVVLDKPAGLTSHDVVAHMRRVLRTRKVGHAGTLDPMATGVLVVAFGRGTRLLGYLQATAKEYEATIRLGVATQTDDRTGAALAEPLAVSMGDHAIDALLHRFTGDILQRPSSVSAVKVEGRRAHALVRSGELVALAARPVTILRFERRGPVRGNELGGLDVDVVVGCSSGTYIRALARDLGDAIGCGGHLRDLRRTAVGPFRLADAAALPALGDPVPPVMSLAAAASAVLPSVALADIEAVRASSGEPIPAAAPVPAGPTALLSPAGNLVAVAEAPDGRWRYLAVFA